MLLYSPLRWASLFPRTCTCPKSPALALLPLSLIPLCYVLLMCITMVRIFKMDVSINVETCNLGLFSVDSFFGLPLGFPPPSLFCVS